MQFVLHMTYTSDQIERVGVDLEGEMGSSVEYYERRVEQARTLAQQASDPAIKRAHFEMVRRYQSIIDSGEVPDGRTLHRVVMDKLGG